MAEPDGQVLDYGRPSQDKPPSRPVDDSTLLIIATALLFGPPAVIAVYVTVPVPGIAILFAVVAMLVWAVASSTMVEITRRRLLRPGSVPWDRPSRIIPAFIFSGLSALMLVFTVCWGVVQVRHMARQMACHENLRSVGQALLLYANDNGGYLPPDLVTLVRTDVLGPETLQILRCPEASVPAAITVTPATTDHDLIAAGATAYVYLGDASVKLSSIPNAASVPIVTELPGNHAKGLVLFADGHNEARTPQDVALMLSDHLAQRGLPTTLPTTTPAR